MVSSGSSYCSSSVVKIGPWGGTGGRPWDDGCHYTGIRSINIQAIHWIDMIRVEYDLYGQPALGEQHGEPLLNPPRDSREFIHLNFPDEYLTTVKGWHDNERIRELAFKTNKKWAFSSIGGSRESHFLTRGNKVYFACSVDGGVGAIVGFSGRSSSVMNSIGLYVAALCPAGEFYDKMEEQGLVVHRTPPLCMPRTSKPA